MRYVLQSQGSEDSVQLFDTNDSPVGAIGSGDIIVDYRKSGATTWTTKSMSGANWTAGTLTGNYVITFANSEFDTLGLFRYRVRSNASAFKSYEDSLYVVTTFPTSTVDPPTITSFSPIPVWRGTSPNTLTITGTDLAGVTSVTVGGTAVTVTANTDTSVEVTIPSGISLGAQTVIVSTAGGAASTSVTVGLHPDDIPGSLCAITGQVFGTPGGVPLQNVSVMGMLLDMPVIVDGIAWTDGKVTTVTDVNGTFSINLPRSKRVEVFIPECAYRREFVVPDEATVNLFTEIP